MSEASDSELRSSMAAAIGEQLTAHLRPIHDGIKQINNTLEMHGGNIDALAEMLDAQGKNMAKLKAQALSTRQRLQRMSMARSRPPSSPLSAEESDEMADSGLESPSVNAT